MFFIGIINKTMHINYLILLRQFFILILIKLYKLGNRTLLIHFKYYDFFYSGLFLHLLIKILLFLSLKIQLYGEFNIILLLLSIYICTVIDIYYYIHLIFYKGIKYLLRYFEGIPAEYFYPYAPESEYIRLYLSYLYKLPKYKFSYNFNKERDRYLLIFQPLFLILISVRYFIIREPLLFLVIHLFVIVNYLQDLNLMLLYLYILILHISRFLYFMSEEYERFKIKKWRASFFTLIVTAPCFGFSELSHLNPNLTYDPKLIQKFTLNNMNLMLYFSLRDISHNINVNIYKIKLAEIDLELPGYYFRNLWYSSTLDYTIMNTLYNYCWYIPHIYQDCQKFVKRNQGFWLATIILLIFFENLITTILIYILIPTTELYLGNISIDNNIYSIFNFEIIKETRKA